MQFSNYKTASVRIPNPKVGSGHDRDVQANEFIPEAISKILQSGERLGWAEPELVLPILSDAIERIVEKEGINRAMNIVGQIQEHLEARARPNAKN